MDGDEAVDFDIEVNAESICEAYSDLSESPDSDSEITSCSSVAYVVEGICYNLNLRFSNLYTKILLMSHTSNVHTKVEHFETLQLISTKVA